MYKIIYSKEINSDLNKIDQTIKNQIFKKIEKISINPEI
jgi:mRNA-degrading endonuclease RelE of RelBE toxin-antitoxin system